MLEVFFHAVEDLDRRRGKPVQPRNAAPLELHFEHLLRTDPRSCLVADDHGQIVAFGIVMRRGAEAFLSFLFAEPSWQGRGLGRAVLDACIEGAGAGVERVATCAEADQPVSTGLYATAGLAPRAPLYLLRGAVAEGALPPLPSGYQRRPVANAAVAELDVRLLGYERPQDHAFWARDRHAVCYLGRSDELLGYGYAHHSGRVGPVAASDPTYLPGIIADLLRSTEVLEGRQLVVPGPAITALRPLIEAGLRIDSTPAVYCSQGAGPAFDRYIPMSFALL